MSPDIPEFNYILYFQGGCSLNIFVLVDPSCTEAVYFPRLSIRINCSRDCVCHQLFSHSLSWVVTDDWSLKCEGPSLVGLETLCGVWCIKSIIHHFTKEINIPSIDLINDVTHTRECSDVDPAIGKFNWVPIW